MTVDFLIGEIEFLIGWIPWKPFFFGYLSLKIISIPVAAWLSSLSARSKKNWTPLRKYFYFLDFPFPTVIFWSRELYERAPFLVYVLTSCCLIFSFVWFLFFVRLLLQTLT